MKANLNYFKIFFYSIIFLIGCLSILSCSDDFLIKEPPGALSDSFMRTNDGVEASLISAYSQLRGRNTFGGGIGSDWIYGSVASDDCYKGSESADQNNINSVERYEVLATNPVLLQRWQDCYDGVARSNLVLDFLFEGINEGTFTNNERAKIIEGEAKFLRAWYHFKANKVFKNIPYVLSRTELNGENPLEISNDSPGWEGIEKDLSDAIGNLPETSPQEEVGRATKFSAMALKAQVFLFQQKFSDAKILLDQIIASNKFNLADNYNDNYDMSSENNSESIFEIQCATTGTNHSAMLIAGPSMHQSGPANLGWGFYQASQSLFNAFQVNSEGLPVLDEDNRVDLDNDMGIKSIDEFHPTDHLLDPRVDWTISRRGIDYLEWGICEGEKWVRNQIDSGPYMTKKFMHKKSEAGLNLNGKGFNNGKNFRAIRFGHVILWRAEVAIEEGDLDYARTLINMIRDRAKNSEVVMGRVNTFVFDGRPIEVDWDSPAANYKIEPYPDNAEAFSTKELARKALRLETRLEFATEGMRFFDLRRWGIDNETLNRYIEQDSEFRNFMRGSVYNSDSDGYLPIPQEQIDLQPGVLKQSR